MSEKKQLLPNKNNAKIQQRNAKIQKSSTPSSADDSTSDPIESIPGTSTSSGILRQAEKNRCENCKDCICRLWRSNLTPEYATLFRIQSESMNKYLSKKNQLIIRNLKVELYPNTGIFLPEVELNLALSKSNNKHRELVRQLLSIIVTEDELIVYKTAENMNKVNSNLRNAIIGYLKKECNVSLSTVEFNDIVRRKIGQAILNKKPKEEIEIAKQKSIERAQKSRNKRKLLHPETDDSTKKTKG